MKTKEKDISYCGVDREKISSSTPIFNLEAKDLFIRFIKERYSIHLKKDVEKLPPPWTDWKNLSVYRFTNVRREHDKQTIHLINSIVKSDLSLEDKILNIILFRFWNKWETFRVLGFPQRMQLFPSSYIEHLREVVKKYSEENPGYIWYTSVFSVGGVRRVWANEIPDYSKESVKENCQPVRGLYLWNWLVKFDIPDQVLKAHDQRDCFLLIKSIPGFGDFLSYQVFVDMTYIPEFPFSENEFTVAGPGCKLGLSFLVKDKSGLTDEEILFWIRDNEKKFLEGSRVNFESLMLDVPLEDRKFNVMMLENLMCEFSKIYRLENKLGHPKNGYRPA